MENKFKVRISRMFDSCKSRDDAAARHNVIEKSSFLSRSHSMPAAAPPMKPLPRPSICKLRTRPSLHINNTCIISSKEARSFVPLSRKNRASTRKSKSKFPVSPVKHFTYSHPFYDRSGTWYYAVGNDCGKKKRRRRRRNKPKALPPFDDHDFFCGDDEREEGDNEDEDDKRTTGTLFSSRSPSSSESSNRCRMSRTKSVVTRTTELGKGGTGVGGSLAMVKKSRDPYGDFRKSMMEMIIERQIFGEDELEQLLLCFLSLNSSHHHKIIVRVFNEIWDALH